MTRKRFPAGWDEARVKGVLDHYESQSGDDAVAEDQATLDDPGQTLIEVPTKIVPRIRELIAESEAQDKS